MRFQVHKGDAWALEAKESKACSAGASTVGVGIVSDMDDVVWRGVGLFESALEGFGSRFAGAQGGRVENGVDEVAEAKLGHDVEEAAIEVGEDNEAMTPFP